MSIPKKAKRKALSRVRHWRDAVKHLMVDDTFDDLLKAHKAAGAATAPRKLRVPVASITIAEKVFQWRGQNSDLAAEERHMRVLIKALDEDPKKDLEPVLLKPSAGKLYLVDGHHRLAAYAAHGRRSIPVTWLEKTLEDARVLSLEANVRDNLPMTQVDKYEAAFELVKDRVKGRIRWTMEQIRQSSGVSPRLVYGMQEKLRKNPEAHSWSWRQTLGHESNKEFKHADGDVRDEMARKVVDQLKKSVKTNLALNPDVAARALEMLSETLPAALIREWEDHAKHYFVELAEAYDPDVASALDRAFTALWRARAEAEEAELVPL